MPPKVVYEIFLPLILFSYLVNVRKSEWPKVTYLASIVVGIQIWFLQIPVVYYNHYTTEKVQNIPRNLSFY